MKKNSTSLRNSGTYTSPGTPDYGDNTVGPVQNGWCSERVPIPNGSRRHISAAAFMPFNSGRALPSKWDDAERWITSPLSSHGVSKTAVAQTHRRPKSKSGPLEIPGVAYFSNYSPAVPILEGGTVRNFTAGSPFTTGVLVADGLSVHYGGGIGVQASPVRAENTMAESSSVSAWSELLAESSLQNAQDGKLDSSSTKDAETMLSPVVYHRDMATQMSPVGSSHSSPKGSSSFSTSLPSIPAAVEPCSTHSAKEEVRDVKIDKGANVTSQSNRHGVRRKKKASPDVMDIASPWDIAEAPNNNSKLQREESKINAWENLRKAKAEAAIQKLEMDLEKKRSASMDKILNKLRVAQMKAQEARRLMSESSANRAHKTSRKGFCFLKNKKIRSLCGCITCHAC